MISLAVKTLEEQVIYHKHKWIQYEQEYILPCFKWAKEAGIDLKNLVSKNPGHNCVELLIKELISKNISLEQYIKGTK